MYFRIILEYIAGSRNPHHIAYEQLTIDIKESTTKKIIIIT